MSKVVIIGATSAIAEAAARRFAQRGDTLCLVGRDSERLAVMTKDLEIRGAPKACYELLDVVDFERHADLIDKAESCLEGIDIVLIAHGTLPDQQRSEEDFAYAREQLEINAISTMSLLTELAKRMERRKHGCLAVITSVAGDRGRQSNYLYGAAKGSVSIFLSGLRNRLSKAGVQVLDIKPGFVDTPMTSDFPKGPLWTKPETIAAGVIKAIDRGKDCAYLPWFWWGIMTIIRNIPERIFKKLSL